MTKTLEQAVAKVKKLSKERQAYAAEVLEVIAEAGDEIYVLSPDERRLVRQGTDELDRGEFVTEEEMRETFDTFRA
jgi:hypothetical protein